MADVQQVDTRHPIEVIRDKLVARQAELRASLGGDVSIEKFVRAVTTSLQINPEIYGCSWQSIWISCMKACRDGLLPDGKEAALVPYKGICSYQPMYQGMLRSFRRSGAFKWVGADVVRNGEVFEYFVDSDGVHFKHVPGDDEDAAVVKVYAAATTKDGGVFVAVLGMKQINEARAMSKATREDAPWKKWPNEMMKKTALKRLTKLLPSARDLVDDDEEPHMERLAMDAGDFPRIVDQQGGREQTKQPPQIGSGAKAALDHFAGESEPEGAGDPAHGVPESPAEQAKQPLDSITRAYNTGVSAKAAGIQRRAMPGEYRDEAHVQEAAAWLAGYDGQQLVPASE